MLSFRRLCFITLVALCCVFFFSPTSAQHHDISIDSVTLLLPSHVCSNKLKPVQRVVKAHGGCFKWHSSSPHIVSVTPVIRPDTRCVVNGIQGTTEAMVGVVYDESLVDSKDNAGLYNGRRSGWVWAEDIHTGRKADCEVFIDRIDTLLIATSTRRINVGDTEALYLQAFDEHGDLFSTLEGLPFQWSNTNNQIAHAISFANANVNVSSTRLALESMGYSGDLLPIQGNRLGRTTFTVSFTCPDLPTPVTTSVDMLVTEPLSINPTLLRICPSTRSVMELFARNHKNLTPGESGGAVTTPSESTSSQRLISMPSVHYKWSSEDPSVATIDADTGVVFTHTPGYTKLHVTDVTLNERSVSSDVLVTKPHRIEVLFYRQLNRRQVEKLSGTTLQAQLQHALEQNGMITESDLLYHQIYENALPRCHASSQRGEPVYHFSPNTSYTARVLVLDHQNRIIDVCDQVVAHFTSTSDAFKSLSASYQSTTGSQQLKKASTGGAEGSLTLESTGFFSFTTSALSPQHQTHSTTLNLSLSTVDPTTGKASAPILTSAFKLMITPPPQPSLPSALIPVTETGNTCQVVVSAHQGSGHYLWSQLAGSDSASSLSSNKTANTHSGSTSLSDMIISISDASQSQTAKTSSSAKPALLIHGGAVALHSSPHEGVTFVHLYDGCNPDASFALPVETSLPAQVGLLPHSIELPVDTPSQAIYQVSDVKGRLFSATNPGCLQLTTTVDYVSHGATTTDHSQKQHTQTQVQPRKTGTTPPPVLTISSQHALYKQDCTQLLMQQPQDPANALSVVPISSHMPSTPLEQHSYGCYVVSLFPTHVGFARVTVSLPKYYQTRLTTYWSNALKKTPQLIKSLGVTTDNKHTYALTLFQRKTVSSPYPYHYPVSSQVFSVYSPLRFSTGMIVGAVNIPMHVRWVGGPLPFPSLGFLPASTHHDAFGYDACLHVDLDTNDTAVTSSSPSSSSSHPVVACTPHTFRPDVQPSLSSFADATLTQFYTPTSIYTVSTTSSNPNNDKSIRDVIRISRANDTSIDGLHIPSHEITVTCLDTHPSNGTNVTLSTGNQPSIYNPYPHLGSSHLSVRCYAPICPKHTEHYLGVNQHWKIDLNDHPLSNSFSYTSQDASIASVSADGVVTGHSLGVTLIHISVDKEHHYGLSAYVVIYVTFSGFKISGNPVVAQHQQQVFSITGEEGESPIDDSFGYVSVQWYLIKGHHDQTRSFHGVSGPTKSTESNNSNLTSHQIESLGRLISDHAYHPQQHLNVFQPITSSPVIQTSSLTGGSTAAFIPSASSSATKASGVPSSSSSFIAVSHAVVHVDGVSVRVGSSSSGASTLVAKVTIRYPSPNPLVLQHIEQHPVQCGSKPIFIPATGSIQEYYVSQHITIEPALVTHTPSNVIIPPDGTIRIQTNLDHMTSRKVFYNAIPLTPHSALAAKANNSTAVKNGVTVHTTGQVFASSVSELMSLAGDVNYDSIVVLRTNSTLSSPDTTSVHVHVRRPALLDLIPTAATPAAQSQPSASLSSSSRAAVSSGLSSSSSSSSPSSSSSSSSSLPHGDFTKRSRVLVFSDLTGDANSPSDSLLEPLCPSSPAIAHHHHTIIDTLANHNVEVDATPSFPSNVTMSLVLRDIAGQIFDSVHLQGNQKASVRIEVDPQHADLISVVPYYTHHTYNVSGKPVRNPIQSSKHKALSSSNKAQPIHDQVHVPLTNPASAMSSVSGASPSITPSVIAGLSFVANANASPSLFTSQVVTIRVSLDFPSWSSPSGENLVKPVYVQLRIGSRGECEQLFTTPPGLRVAFPIKPPMSPAPGNERASVSPPQGSAYLMEILSRVSLTTQLAIDDAIKTTTREYFDSTTGEPLVESLAVAIPHFKPFIRSVDTFTGYVLVDLVPTSANRLRGTASTIGKETTILHLHQQQWLDAPGPSHGDDGVSAAVSVSAMDVAIALTRRFNITIPTVNRSKHAAAALSSYSSAPNLAITGDEPTFPFRTAYDKACSEYLDFALPIYISITPHSQSLALLTSIDAISHDLPLTSFHRVMVTRNTVKPSEITVSPDLIGLIARQQHLKQQQQQPFVWPFPGQSIVQVSSSRDHTALTLTCLALSRHGSYSYDGHNPSPSTTSSPSPSLTVSRVGRRPEDIAKPFLALTVPPSSPAWLSMPSHSKWITNPSLELDICGNVLTTTSGGSSSPWVRALSHQFTAITQQQQQHYDRLVALSKGKTIAGGDLHTASSSPRAHQDTSSSSPSGFKLTVIFTLIALLTGSAILYTNMISNAKSHQQQQQQPQVQLHPRVTSPVLRTPHRNASRGGDSSRIFYDYDQDTE